MFRGGNEYIYIGGEDMCFYIRIEDLTANAMIETMKKSDKRFLTYKEIEAYGAKVVQYLNAKGEKAVLVLSRDNTNAFLRNYSEYFVEKNVDGIMGIELKKDKGIDDLIEQFRGYLALDVLLAFVDKKTIQILGG